MKWKEFNLVKDNVNEFVIFVGDYDGECRVYGNLGLAYFFKGYYKEALFNYRYQLVFAMKFK